MRNLFPPRNEKGEIENVEIQIRDNGEEAFFHGTYDFPVEIYARHMFNNPMHRISWHWHNAMQFTIVQSGRLCFFADQQKYELKEGEGIFISAGVVHGMQPCDEQEDCVYITINFTSKVIASFPGSILEIKYVEPYLLNQIHYCYVLRRDNPQSAQILDQVNQLCEVYSHMDFGYELDVFGLLCSIWRKIISSQDYRSIQVATLASQRLKAILEYIHNNYSRKITLQEVADLVHICPNECCRLLKKNIHCTLFEYIMDYRLIQSTSFLKNTDLSVEDIAFETGFGSASYFISNFKKKFNCTPKVFRNDINQQQESLSWRNKK